MNAKTGLRYPLTQILIALPLFFNLQCAFAFLSAPQKYANGFEIQGIAGEGIVRGFGILFLMWNIPYAVALLNPIRHRSSLWEAVAMQSVGLIGETLLLTSIPAQHPALTTTVYRFILFDAGGLAFLLLAVWISYKITAPNASFQL